MWRYQYWGKNINCIKTVPAGVKMEIEKLEIREALKINWSAIS